MISCCLVGEKMEDKIMDSWLYFHSTILFPSPFLFSLFSETLSKFLLQQSTTTVSIVVIFASFETFFLRYLLRNVGGVCCSSLLEPMNLCNFRS